MTTLINLRRYLLISLTLVVLNLLPFAVFGWRIFFGILYLFFFSLALGNWLFIKNSVTCKLVMGFLFLLIIISLIGTLAFYCWQINLTVFYLTLIVIPLLLIPAINKFPIILEFAPLRIKLDYRQIILLVSYLVLIIFIVYLLFTFQTTESIRSPWLALPQQIFLLYFLATLFLIFFLIISRNTFNLSLICGHLFLTLSVALIIYKIGFDYDPFIHRKNVELIMANGTLLPKPFYYIGQYAIIIFLKNLLTAPAAWLDKLLVPVLSAIYLPSIIYFSFKDNFKIKSNYLYLTIISLFIFPLNNFIVTTPQALASLMFIFTILLAIFYAVFPKTSVIPLILLAFFTLTVHPLAGLPLLFTVILLILFIKLQKKVPLPKILHRGIIWEVFILGCLALPVAFVINSQTLSQLKVNFNFGWLTNITEKLSGDLNIFYRPFITIYDFVYSYANNLLLLFCFLVIIGVYLLHKQGQLKNYFIYIVSAGMIFINYYLLKTGVDFFSLVDYERLNYPLRVLNLSLYSFAPVVIMVIYVFVEKIFYQKTLIIILTAILLSLGITTSFYLSYPKVDTIKESHGYSTSSTDIKTVNFIEQRQNNKPYVVLASQPVSAAAISELGYKYYYNDVFFYPVPTGGKLYSLYEDLIYQKETTPDIIATTRYLTGVNDIYFIINTYWLDAESRVTEEKDLADEWFAIDGKNYIFKYSY